MERNKGTTRLILLALKLLAFSPLWTGFHHVISILCSSQFLSIWVCLQTERQQFHGQNEIEEHLDFEVLPSILIFRSHYPFSPGTDNKLLVWGAFFQRFTVELHTGARHLQAQHLKTSQPPQLFVSQSHPADLWGSGYPTYMWNIPEYDL